MNGESCVTVCMPLCNKVDILQKNVEILKCMKNNKNGCLEIIQKIESTVNLMLADKNELQQLLEEQQALYNEMKVENVEISHLLYKVNALHAEKNVHKDSDSICCNFMNYSSESEQIESAPQISGSSCVDFSPIVLNTAPSSLTREDLKPRSIAFDIAYLAEEEYKLLPKYMVGRLTHDAINKFIDVVNDAFSKKYNILSKKMSTLKAQELNLFRKYKHQQSFELKGKHFIIEEDIAREFNKTGLEKKSYSFLTILRHTKRLLQNKIDGVTVYIATSNH